MYNLYCFIYDKIYDFIYNSVKNYNYPNIN